MTNRSPVRTAAGKLTSALQQLWVEHLGEPPTDELLEDAMHHSHALQCDSTDEVLVVLEGRSVREFVGVELATRDIRVAAAISRLEALLYRA